MNMSLSTRYIALVLILVLGTTAGCIRSPDKEYGATGEYLAVGAYLPQLLDRVVYTVQGQNYVITPKQEGTIIASVRARAVNLESTQVTLSVDENAAMLITSGGEEFKPFEPGARAVKTSDLAPEDNPYGSHIWGQLQLLKNYEIAGWFFFEVPKDSEFAAFSWKDVELIRVRYQQ